MRKIRWFSGGFPLVSDPWLSADDIAAHLGVTKDTVYVWIAEKAMPAHKVGRLWKFQASEVDEWVRSGSAASTADGVTRDGA
jgi:excisionase family DNA binding protein